VHLDEVKIFLQQLRLLSCLMNDIDFVAQNYNRNAKVDFEDAITEGHIESDIHLVGTHVGLKVVNAGGGRLELFLPRNYQIAVVVEVRFFVCLGVPLNFLLHLLVRSHLHIR